MPNLGRNVALAVAAAGGGLAIATGFPNRVGVTKTDCRLSLPGDLVFPTARVIADQARIFRASPAQLWPSLFYVEELFTQLWGRTLDAVYEEPDRMLVWKTRGNDSGWDATCAAVLLLGPDGTTTVHLRQRYLTANGVKEFGAYGRILMTGIRVHQVWRHVSATLAP